MVAKINLEELKVRLDEVPCKPRLYPTRLFALQILTGKKLDELIDEKIIQLLSKVTGFQEPRFKYRFTPATLTPRGTGGASSAWVHGFIDDMATFGLREAILYFNSYEFLSNPDDLINNAVAVYHVIAKSYTDNAEKLENSNDETIKSQMLVAKLYGEGTPQTIKGQNVFPKKKKRKQVHRPSKKKLSELVKEHALDACPEFDEDLAPDEILDIYGVDPKNPETYKEEIVELIDCELMYGGLPGFEGGVLRVAEILDEYGIDLRSEVGQEVLETYVSHAQEEYYGDFYRFTDCSKCGEEFRPVHSLKYANQVLSQEVFCPKCSKDLKSSGV